MKDMVGKVIIASILAITICSLGLYLSYKSDLNQKIETIKLIYMYTEKGYFEGQKDAIEGDIRIRKNGNIYEWTKSPWDDGSKPMYKGNIE